ncbi:MAG: hypothetical protein JW822_07750 [Spirochaetales bacterium]|nr:hypothetical protein [Spirochaetales bacterium]
MWATYVAIAGLIPFTLIEQRLFHADAMTGNVRRIDEVTQYLLSRQERNAAGMPATTAGITYTRNYHSCLLYHIWPIR